MPFSYYIIVEIAEISGNDLQTRIKYFMTQAKDLPIDERKKFLEIK